MFDSRHLICGLLNIITIIYTINSKVILTNDLTNTICINQSSNAFVVHPNNCNAYFQCYDNGQGIIKYCTNTSWFNDKTQLCDESFNECILLNDEHEIDDVSSNFTGGDNSNSTIASTVMAELPTTSMPNNTTEFVSSTIIVTTSVTNITPSTIITIKPSTASTTTTVLSPSSITSSTTTIKPTDAITDSTSTRPTTVLSTTNIISTTTQRPPLIDSIYNNCPMFDTPYLTYLPNQFECSSYYLCYHGQAMRLYCPTHYHWHNVFKKCVPVSQSDCFIPQISTPCMPRCPEYGQYFYPHPDNCGHFYYCENGYLSVQQCDAFYHWDVNQKRCLLKIGAKCIRSVPKDRRYFYYL